MKASEIVAAVVRKIQDPSYDNDDVLAMVNQGIIDVASGGDRQHGFPLLPPLPDLFTVDEVTVDAGDSYIDMPSEFLRALTRVEHGGEALRRYDSHIKFLSRFRGETGPVEAYCLVGRRLWIGPVPTSTTTLTVFFYAAPTLLEEEDDEPTYIPAHLQRRLLVNYACKEIFSEIEQGLEGALPDTKKHDTEYQRALTDLERFLGPADGVAENIADEDFTDDMIL